MRQWFTSIVEKCAKLGKRRPVARTQRQARLGLEALEQREVLSGTPLTWTAPSGNTANNIILSVVNGNIQVLDNNAVVASRAVASTSSVTLTDSASAMNTLDIQNTVAGIPTTVNLETSADAVEVGNASSVQGIQGAVTINGFKGAGKVIVDDSADLGTRSATLSGSSITGLAPAAISYSGVNSLTVYGSKGSGNRYTVTGNPGSFGLYDESSSDQVFLNLNSGTLIAHGLAGDVASLIGPSSGTNTFTNGFNSMSQPDDTLKGPGYSVEVVNFIHVTCTSHSTSDIANPTSLFCVTGSTFTSGFNTSGQGDDTLNGPGYSVEVVNFPHVSCSSNSPMGDVANLASISSGTGSTFTYGFDSIYGPTDATLKGSSYSVEAVGFVRLSCTSHNTSDVASLASISSGTASTFTSGFNAIGQGDDTLISDYGFSVEAVNFTKVSCTSHNTRDVANLVSESRGTGSTFTSGFNTIGQGDDTLKGPGYSVEVVNFIQVSCTSHNTSDVATLFGASSGTNTFTGNSTSATLTSSGASVQALDFSKYYAYNTSAGNVTSGIAQLHFWSQATGAHQVNGVILAKWYSLGGPQSSLGDPTSDTLYLIAEGQGVYFNTFQHGVIVSSPSLGVRVLNNIPGVLSYTTGSDGTLYLIKDDASLWRSFDGSLQYLLGGVQQVTPLGAGTVAVQLESGISATLAVQYNQGTGALTIQASNIQLNVSAFLNNVLGPIVHSVQIVTEPQEKIAQFLVAPLPVLSDISHLIGKGDITAASLTGNPLIAKVANAIIATNNLSVPSSSSSVAMGSVTLVDAHPGVAGPLSVVNSQLLGFTTQIQSIFGGFEHTVQQIGIDFPVLDNPGELIQMLAGNNEPLFTYTLPSLKFTAQLNPLLFVMPTPIPGVTVGIYGQIGVSMSLGATFGCDSSGLLTGNLLNGFFVQNVVCSVGLNVGLKGELNVVFAGLDLSGGLGAQANLTLSGPAGSNAITGTDLANGSVSLHMTGSVSGSASGSVWASLPFVGKITYRLFNFTFPLFNF